MLEKILNVLGWLGVGVVFVGMVARFVIPEQQDLWWWLLVGGLVLVLVYTLGQWRSVVEVFSRRQARYGTLATSGVLLGLLILVGANYILARQNARWDLTAARQYSLSDQTISILESLEMPIRVLVFATELEFPSYRDRLAEYEHTSSQVSLEFIDVDKNPVLAQQYEIRSYGTVVFDYNGRIERVVSDQEQELTNALIKAVEGEERKVYFLQGHGERIPTDTEREGYSSLTDGLRLDNLSVDTLILAQIGEVPSDASVVVVAGPATDLFPAEVDLLREYLDGGGKMLFLIDPPTEPDAVASNNLIGFIREWGIEIGLDIVVDVSGIGQLVGTDATAPVAAAYPSHPITNDLGNLITAFPLARSVKPVPGGSDGRFAESFVETTPRSWAESTLDLTSGEVALEEDQGDVPGPVSIAAAVSIEIPAAVAASTPTDGENEAENDTDESPSEIRIAVFGDSDFATNGRLGIGGNRDLALNTMSWLTEQENLISIRPRQPEDRRITMTADQQFRVVLVSLLLIPALIIGAGILTWWRRR